MGRRRVGSRKPGGHEGELGGFAAGELRLFPLSPPFVDRDSKLGIVTLLSMRSSKWLLLSLGHDGFSSHLYPLGASMGKSDIDMKWP